MFEFLSRRARNDTVGPAPSPGETPAPPSGRALPGVVLDSTIERNESVFDENRRSVIDAGLLQDAPEFTEDDANLAAQLARIKTRCEPWDVDGNPADRLADERYQANLARRPDLADAVASADAELRRREDELADLGLRPVAPAWPAAVAVLGVLGVGLSLTLAFDELFFRALLLDVSRSLLASFLAGSMLAALLVVGMLEGARLPGLRGRLVNGGWLAAALGLAASLYLMRRSLVDDEPSHVLALGFTVLELVSIGVVELFALGLGAAWTDHRARREPFDRAAARVQAALLVLEARWAELGRIQGEIDEHEDWVHARTAAHFAGKHHEAAARATAIAGKTRGRFLNSGFAYDGNRPVPTAAGLRARHHGLTDPDHEEER